MIPVPSARVLQAPSADVRSDHPNALAPGRRSIHRETASARH